MDKQELIEERVVDILYDMNDFYKSLSKEQILHCIEHGGFPDAVELAKKGYIKVDKDSVVVSKKEIKIYQEIYDFMKEKGLVSVGEMKTLISFILKGSMLKAHIIKETAEKFAKRVKELSQEQEVKTLFGCTKFYYIGNECLNEITREFGKE